MNKLLLAISATFLLNSTLAQAEVKTFNFTFSGADFSNTAITNGFVTFDTDDFVSDGNNYSLQSPLIDYGVTVSGSNSGNGTFTYDDIIFFYFESPIALDFSRELVGQSSAGRGFGPSFNTGGGEGGDFNMIYSLNPIVPSGINNFTLAASNSGESMILTSFAPASVAAVPEADTSALLLTGLGVMGFMARRRNKAKAA